MQGLAALSRRSVGPALLQPPRRQRRAAPPPAAAARQKQQRTPQQQQQQQQPAGKGFGKAAGEPVTRTAEQPAAAAPEPAPAPPPSAAVPDSSGALPAVGRGNVFAACTQVSLLVTVLALGLRQVAPAIAPAVGEGQGELVESLLNWVALPSASQLALAAGVAAAVTGARGALLAVWPEFRQASDRSNSQVLAPLGVADVLWVGVLPAVSEELLFRGALVPAIYPDWRGVLIAGAAFGALHAGGGRNAAFAAWAAAVGCAYGALFLATGSVACPVLAHSLANVASAGLWKAANGGGGARGSN